MLDIIEDILKIFAKNGLFDEGVELVGSWSFLMYQKYLGAQSLPFVTHDVDFLIPNPFQGNDHPDLLEQLLKVLSRAEKSLPLYSQEIERINLTLQSAIQS